MRRFFSISAALLLCAIATAYATTDDIDGHFYHRTSEGALIRLFAKSDPVVLKKHWEKFKVDEGKHYGSQVEDAKRYDVFIQNLNDVDDNNIKEGRVVYGITKFSDLTKEEFSAKYLGKPSDIQSFTRSLKEKSKPAPSSLRSVNTKLQAVAVDWSATLATPIKNQGGCGSCWAFAAVEQVESDAIRLLGFSRDTLRLSTQQVTSCDTSNYGCDGGFEYRALEYIKTVGGLVSEAAYPYLSGNDGVTRSCLLNAVNFNPVVSVTNYFAVNGESAMKTFVETTGPLMVSVNADTWGSYVSGIVTEASCTLGSGLNHVVQAVGINIPATGVPYWKIRNQWGNWGINGFMYVKYGTQTCGIDAGPGWHSAVSTAATKSPAWVPPPTKSPSTVIPVPFLCPAFSFASGSNSALNLYASCSMMACPGDRITISGCYGGMTCTSDTFIRLVDGNGNEIANNDDEACSTTLCPNQCYASGMQYTVPNPFPYTDSCQIFTIRQGCYNDVSCSGQLTVSGATSVSNPPSFPLTSIPTNPSPTKSPDWVDTSFFCPSYSLSNTYSAVSAYADCTMRACPGDNIDIDGCRSGMACISDTYIRLLDVNGLEVANNDDTDFCSYCPSTCYVSRISYTVPQSASCQTYTLRQGCYSTNSCSAQFYVTGAAKVISPTRTPSSRSPTRKPISRSPTRKPSSRSPTRTPSSRSPTRTPSSRSPTRAPTRSPTRVPTSKAPTRSPSKPTTRNPIRVPTIRPSRSRRRRPRI